MRKRPRLLPSTTMSSVVTTSELEQEWIEVPEQEKPPITVTIIPNDAEGLTASGIAPTLPRPCRESFLVQKYIDFAFLRLYMQSSVTRTVYPEERVHDSYIHKEEIEERKNIFVKDICARGEPRPTQVSSTRLVVWACAFLSLVIIAVIGDFVLLAAVYGVKFTSSPGALIAHIVLLLCFYGFSFATQLFATWAYKYPILAIYDVAVHRLPTADAPDSMPHGMANHSRPPLQV